jgi:hypothetical protein
MNIFYLNIFENQINEMKIININGYNFYTQLYNDDKNLSKLNYSIK